MNLKYYYLALFLMLFIGCGNINGKQDINSNRKFFVVTKVVDGDTFWIEDQEGKREKIRFIGIDAPESRKSRHKDIQYFGKESSDYLKRYLKNKKVALEFDVTKRDKYGRILAYVFMEDGTFLNDHLVRNGYARAATYPPNVKYQDKFVESDRYARENNLGMWNR